MPETKTYTVHKATVGSTNKEGGGKYTSSRGGSVAAKKAAQKLLAGGSETTAHIELRESGVHDKVLCYTVHRVNNEKTVMIKGKEVKYKYSFKTKKTGTKQI